MNILCPNCSTVVKVPSTTGGGTHPCERCAQAITLPDEIPAPGVVLGDFLLECNIAEGGMASIWKGLQLSLSRPTAIKICPEKGPHGKKLQHEALIMGGLDIRRVPHVYSWGLEEGLSFLAMEFLSGSSLAETVISQGPMSPIRACQITANLAETLHTLWAQREVVHCDIKPENVILTDGNELKLIDFGIATIGQKGSDDEAANDGEVVGSVFYMSPEQVLGQRMDHRSDLYGLGIMLYFMLTGKEPFLGETPYEVATQHLTVAPVPLSELVENLPQGLSELALELLAKAMDARPQDGRIVSRRLEGIVARQAGARKSVHSLGATQPSTDTSTGKASEEQLERAWTCSVCGGENEEGSRFCADCGNAAVQPCPLCGEDLHSAAIYCLHCGGDVDQTRDKTACTTESLLDQLRELQDNHGEIRDVLRAVQAVRKRGLGTLAPKEQNDFVVIVTKWIDESQGRLEEAREIRRMDLYEKEVEILGLLAGAEATLAHEQQMTAFKAGLADALLRANTAFQSNCPSQCLEILLDMPQWSGGIADRREELLVECKEQTQRREATLRELSDLDEITQDGDAIAAAMTRLLAVKVSTRYQTIVPAPEDKACDEHAQELLLKLKEASVEQMRKWVEGGEWERAGDLLGELRAHTGSPLMGQLGGELERLVEDRIRELQDKGHKLELERRLIQVESVWELLLSIPESLVPNAVRQIAEDFPNRKLRILKLARESVLKHHRTALLLVWSLGAFLAFSDYARIRGNAPPALTHAVPEVVILLLQLVIVLVGFHILHKEKFMGSDDLVAGRIHSPFALGLCLLWILSPASFLFMESLRRAFLGQVGGNYMQDQLFYYALWVAGVWLVVDVSRGKKRAALPESLALAASWILGAFLVVSLCPENLVSSMQIRAMTLLQAILFITMQMGARHLYRTWSQQARQDGAGKDAPPEESAPKDAPA
ncbi:MAG: protein kinase [Lentisphaeria bacterium]|nr:protein kinase [Lentisphaeria bacterium]